MVLRVARGLLRLWLFLSVLWIGGVGVVTWRTFPSEPAWQPAERPPWAEDQQNPPPAGYVINQPSNQHAEAIRSAIVLALVPPAFVLALGSALVWAFRGFR